MFVFLPILALVLISIIGTYYSKDWRISVLSGSLIWGIMITLYTEFFSLLNQLRFETILTTWILTNLVLLVIYFFLLKSRHHTIPKIKLSYLTPIDIILLIGISFFILTTGLIAIISPPNNWDSMTYHLPRVMHWIQNQSLRHYPTYYSAQIVHPPFAELAILNLQILSKSDRYVNLIQWFSMIGSVIGVSLIAKQFGSNLRGQIFASVFCVTIPMGILQASSTQNDYVVAYWLVCLGYFTILSLSYKQVPLNIVVAIAASFSLAIFTKSSGYIYGLPFMVFLLFVNFNKLRWKLWKPFCIIILFVLLINGNHYLRNLEVYGHPLSTAEYENHYAIEIYSLPTFFSNVIRNLSLHLDIVRYLHLDHWITPTTGISMKIIKIIHEFIGVDINDIRTTYPPNSYQVPGLSFNEDVAGNPLHLIGIFLALLSLLIWKLKRIEKKREILGYLIIVTSSFLFFCFLLKIQPYHGRHHLSIFILFSPLVGSIISKTWNRYLVIGLAMLFLVSSLQFLFLSSQRPILKETNIFNTERERIYFLNRQHIENDYIEAAKLLKGQGCRNIGLYFLEETGNIWEYPIWSLTKQNSAENSFKFQHFSPRSIKNPSYIQRQKSPFKEFQPCGILMIDRGNKNSISSEKELTIEQQVYQRQWQSNVITLFFKQ